VANTPFNRRPYNDLIAGVPGRGLSTSSRPAALYIRVSTEEQVQEGLSLEVQRERLTAFAASLGWPVHRIYQDAGVSGGTLHRPALQQLLSDIEAGRVRGVLVTKLDRISRRLRDLLWLYEDVFIPRDVSLFSLAESIDTSTAAGRLFFQIIGSFAEFERERFKERLIPGMRKSAEHGHWQGGPGPFGYTYDAEARHLVPHPHQAGVIRQIFQWYENGWSANRIARALQERKEEAQRGGRWVASQILRILSNRAHCGDLVWGRRTIQHGPSGRPRIVWAPQAAVIERAQTHEPIISREQWERVRHLRKERSRGGRKVASPYPLTGILVCAECGNSFYGWTPRRQRRYICDGVRRHKCHAPSMAAEPVESVVLSVLGAVTKDKRVVSAVLELADRRRASQDPALATEISKLKASLEQVDRKRSTAMEWAYARVLTTAELQAEMERLAHEEEGLQRNLRTLENRVADQAAASAERERILATLRNFPSVWKALSPEEQKELVRTVIARVLIKEKTIESIQCRDEVLGGLALTFKGWVRAKGGRNAINAVYDMTTNGHPMAQFTIAVNRDFKNAAGEREADFVRCVTWRKLAEQVGQYCAKGRLVAVEGRLQTRNYEAPDGSRRTITEVVGDRVWFLDSRRVEGDGEASQVGADAQESAPELIGDPDEAAVETNATS